MMWAVKRAAVVLVSAVLVSACATQSVEQRSTQGPTAEQLFVFRVAVLNGREPTFDERRHWDNDIDVRISQYLAAHPEVANSLDVSTFRFFRQVTVGMSKEQVLILLGPPATTTSDAGEIEKLARRFWPAIQGSATEAWVYPGGWRLYFAGPRLADITQYLP